MFILILLSIFGTYYIYPYFNVQIISDPVIRADRTVLVAPSVFVATTEQCLDLVIVELNH